MDTGQWLTLVTYAGLLALGVVSALRVRESPLAGPLAAICLVSFIWNFAIWAHSVSGHWAWIYIDRTASPWTFPAGAQFVLTFVGLRRRQRPALIAFCCACGVLSGVAASGFFSEWGRVAAASPTWDNLLASLTLVYFVWASVLLVRHLIRQESAEEKMRTRLMIAATIFPELVGGAELLMHEHFVVPAMLPFVVLLTVVAFGLKLFDNELTGLAAVYAAAIALIASGAYIVAFKMLAPNAGMTALAIFAISLCWIALLAQTWRAAAQHRARVERLTVLGRLASQMAHDLKNPLSALKGAAQYLAEERACGRSIDGQHEFIDLLVNESERLSRLIDRYQRLGRLESVRSRVAVNELVQRVLDVHRLAVRSEVAARVELGDELPDCALDADLVATALENLLRNASEAMESGGILTVRTERVCDTPESEAVAITVEDSGRGMDARELERAFDEFYSTKPTGSGLGLPLVKRVVEAHGGRISVRSNVGKGTQIVLSFPVT